MEKIITKSGYVAYKVSLEELKKINGGNICDFCNTEINNGYLIPVLNQFYCKECFENWQNNVDYYPEDIRIENSVSEYYELMIKLDQTTITKISNKAKLIENFLEALDDTCFPVQIDWNKKDLYIRGIVDALSSVLNSKKDFENENN